MSKCIVCGKEYDGRADSKTCSGSCRAKRTRMDAKRTVTKRTPQAHGQPEQVKADKPKDLANSKYVTMLKSHGQARHKAGKLTDRIPPPEVIANMAGTIQAKIDGADNVAKRLDDAFGKDWQPGVDGASKPDLLAIAMPATYEVIVYKLIPDEKVYGRRAASYEGDKFATRPEPHDINDLPCPRNRGRYTRRDGTGYQFDCTGNSFEVTSQGRIVANTSPLSSQTQATGSNHG